ncbi:MAG: hypothetical protein HYX61_01595 [Gammaproteobacteria bacterium]|nr:hypothetical protein [Gammaproteobacteria bacterium]
MTLLAFTDEQMALLNAKEYHSIRQVILDAMAKSDFAGISFRFRDINPDTAEHIVKCLAGLSFKALDLIDTHLNDAALLVLLNGLDGQNFETLDLSYNAFTPIGYQALFQFLQKNRSVTSLSLKRHDMVTAQLDVFVDDIPKTNLHILDLSDNYLNDTDLLRVAYSAKNAHLTTLDVGNNLSTEKGMTPFAEALLNSAVVHMDVATSHFSEVAKLALKETCLFNTLLGHLRDDDPSLLFKQQSVTILWRRDLERKAVSAQVNDDLHVQVDLIAAIRKCAS